MTLLLLLVLVTAPPDTLRLEDAYREAATHHPRQAELPLHTALADLRVHNLNTRFLPDLALRGQATYQSDVPSIPFSAPGFTPPEVSKDQYRVALGVEQLVYDGGLTAVQRALEYVQRDLARQEVAVDVYRLRDQVNAAFFGVLVQEAHAASLAVLAEDLRARRDRLAAQVEAGVGTPANVDVLSVELLRVEQQQAEAAARRRAALDVLGTLLGRPLPDDVVLVPPSLPEAAPAPDARRRPEYRAFDLRRTLLAEQARLAGRQTRPRVSAFAEAAYGRPPGNDLFENTFQPFYSLGVRMQWGFWDWRRSRRERQALSLQQQLVAAQEAAFTRQLDVAATEQRHEVARLEELLARDDEIIALRARITAEAASRLENGVITATDFLIERNAEHRARLTRDLHALQLLQARVQYMTILGAQ